jgi:hypothetical protein
MGRGIALLFHVHCTRRGWGFSVTPWPLSTPGKDQIPIVQETGWAPGPVWRGAEKLASTRIRSPDRPSRSQSLYRLSYPAHDLYENTTKLQINISTSLECTESTDVWKLYLICVLQPLHSCYSTWEETQIFCPQQVTLFKSIYEGANALVVFHSSPPCLWRDVKLSDEVKFTFYHMH